MRRFLLLAATLLGATTLPALAAPTCQDANGSVARCGAANAMPLGWKLSDEEYHRRQAALGNVFDPRELLNAIALIAALLAIIALLPDFDGRSDDDWDEQEGQDRTRHP
jgi:hypothetical protein